MTRSFAEFLANSPDLIAIPEAVQAEFVESLAIPVARDYAEKNYKRRPDGTFEPAWRADDGRKAWKGKTPSEVAEMEGISVEEAREQMTDLANDSYSAYSEFWKSQNRGGAQFLIRLLSERGMAAILALDLSDEATRQEYGTLVHQNWLDRNQWVLDEQYGDPVLAKPFADLPEVEQEKDIDQMRVLQRWLDESFKQ